MKNNSCELGLFDAVGNELDKTLLNFTTTEIEHISIFY